MSRLQSLSWKGRAAIIPGITSPHLFPIEKKWRPSPAAIAIKYVQGC